MAEFLIKARNPIDITADTEASNSGWKRGDIVVVKPDGHEWGKDERLPKFVVVKIPGLPVETAKKYTIPFRTDTGLLDSEGNSISKYVARRKWHVLLDSVPTDIKKALLYNGEITVSWENVKSYIHNKETLVTE